MGRLLSIGEIHSTCFYQGFALLALSWVTMITFTGKSVEFPARPDLCAESMENEFRNCLSVHLSNFKWCVFPDFFNEDDKLFSPPYNLLR